MTKKTKEPKFPKDWGKINGVDFSDRAETFCSAKLTWDELKKKGNAHYKTGGLEPIDIYKATGMFNHFARCNIIKYAFRLKGKDDLDKIIHYAQLLKAELEEIERSDKS